MGTHTGTIEQPRSTDVDKTGRLRRKTPRRRADAANSERPGDAFIGIHTVDEQMAGRRGGESERTRRLVGILDALKKKRAGFSRYDDEAALDMADTVRNLGNQQFVRGNFSCAYCAYEEELKIRRTALGASHPSTIAPLENICAIDFARGSHSILARNLRRLLELKQEHFGWSHPETALVYQRLGDAYRIGGDFDGALGCYTSALTIRWLQPGVSQYDLVSLLERFGDCYFVKGSYQRAYKSYAEVRRLKQKDPGEYDLASTLHKTGLLLRVAGNHEESAKLLSQALGVKREEEQRGVRLCSNGSGDVEAVIYSGEYNQASDLPSLGDLDRCFDGISLSAILKNNARAISVTGDASNRGEVDSEEHNNDSLDLILSTLAGGSDSPSGSDCGGEEKIIRFSSPLVTTVHQVPSLETEDIPSLYYSPDDINRFRRDKHVRYCRKVCVVLDNTGLQQLEKGEYSNALEAFTHSLRIKTDILGNEKDMSTASTIQYIGDVYCKQLKLDKAVGAYEAALSMQKHSLGAKDRRLLPTLSKIASLYTKTGQFKLASTIYSEILQLRKMRLGPDHLLVAVTHDSIGDLHFKQAEHQEALDHFIESLHIKKAQLGNSHKDVATTLKRIAKVLEIRGERQQARDYCLQAQGILEQSFDGENVEISLGYINIAAPNGEEEVGRVLIEV